MQEHPQSRVRAAGILLMLRPTNEFLLMRHRDRWDLPKGHCEDGETFLETAKRETTEETGIDSKSFAIDPDFRFEISYDVTYQRYGNQTRHKTVCYFLAYLETKPPLVLTEHESSQWFAWQPPHEIQAETINPLLAAVENYLSRTERDH